MKQEQYYELPWDHKCFENTTAEVIIPKGTLIKMVHYSSPRVAQILTVQSRLWLCDANSTRGIQILAKARPIEIAKVLYAD